MARTRTNLLFSFYSCFAVSCKVWSSLGQYELKTWYVFLKIILWHTTHMQCSKHTVLRYNEAWAKLEKNSTLQRVVTVLVLIWEGEFFTYSTSHNKVGKLRPLNDSEINQHLSHSW
jgi:hypothetical protein